MAKIQGSFDILAVGGTEIGTTLPVADAAMAARKKTLVSGTAVYIANPMASLANAGKYATGEITPTEDYEYLKVCVMLETAGARSGTPTIDVWYLHTRDGTNYDSADTTPFPINRAADLTLTFTTSTGLEIVTQTFRKPAAGKYKLLFRNSTGQTLASGSILYTPEGSVV
jgi:hypothetical protein